MYRLMRLLLLLLFFGFVALSSVPWRLSRIIPITMRDGSTSSNYFAVNDRVLVITDVWHNCNSGKFSSKGKRGIVTEVWEVLIISDFPAKILK